MKNFYQQHKEDIIFTSLSISSLLLLFSIVFILLLIPITTDLRDQVIILREQVQDANTKYAVCRSQLDTIQQQGDTPNE